MATEIPVVLACDDRFAKHTAVTIASMLTNAAPDTVYRIHVLHAGLDPSNIARLQSLVAIKPACSIRDVNVGDAYRDAPAREALPVASYYRLLPHQLLPYDKIVYLDSDMVVTTDLGPLFSTDLGVTYFGAVPSPGARPERIATNLRTGERVHFLSYLEGLGLPPNIAVDWYVNAGLLLINARQMRADRLEQRFAEIIGKTDYLFAADQDVLNVAAGNRKTLLDLTWNFQTTLPFVREQPQVRAWLANHRSFAQQIDQYIAQRPAVIHFVHAKPWRPVGDPGPYASLYWQYLSMTPWTRSGWVRPFVTASRPIVNRWRRLRAIAGEAKRRLVALVR